MFLPQAFSGSNGGSPVTSRGTSSFKMLVERVRGLDAAEIASMQSPNKTKYSRSESKGAGIRVGDHSVGQHSP